MKIILKRIASCLVVICLTAGMLIKATDILERKDSEYKYKPFFEHSKDMDVLFFGNSHVLNGIFPMELWDKYGITSYNFGGHANHIPTTYWVMKNSLDYAKPKVVVIDCSDISSNLKTDDNFSYVHISFDAFPLSINKIKAANDILNDPEIEKMMREGHMYDSETRTRLGLLWDFSVYHSRWDEITMENFSKEKSLEYGAESRINVEAPEKSINNNGLVVENQENNVGVQYLKKIIESCQQDDIEVLLIYLPHPMVEDKHWVDANTAGIIAQQYGLNYINFMDMNLVDFDTDLYDSSSHLNPSGAWKVTDYIGDYLQTNYGIEDHRSSDKYDYWNLDYTSYEAYKIDRLEKEESFLKYLMLLQDRHYGFTMTVDNPSIYDNPVMMKYLEAKGVNTKAISADTKVIVANGKDSYTLDEEQTKGNYEIRDGKVFVNVFDIDDPDTIISSREF